MESTAKLKYIRIAPRKMRLVADLVRGRRLNDAFSILEYSLKKSSKPIEKTLKSAMSNMMNKPEAKGVDVDSVFIKFIDVQDGPTTRRFMPRAMGRATKIRKRSSHLTVVLAAKSEE
ncbi:50S ribosomal protein L22 [bacterium]|nr:50S ribosomal protein L22 [FCB group bacterium]MBL7190946.1 50S ribosomal protein L22 [bacterium]